MGYRYNRNNKSCRHSAAILFLRRIFSMKNQTNNKAADRQSVSNHSASTQLQIFEHNNFGRIRTITIDGEPWFVGKDVSDALGYVNTRKALLDHVDEADRNTVTIRDGIPGNPNKTIINESGLYSLVLSSKLPQARTFRRWITSSVIPSIRKHGAYITDDTLDSMMNSPEFTEALMDALLEENAKYVELNGRYNALSDKYSTLSEKSIALARINASLATDVEELEDSVSSLEGTVGTLEGVVGTLEDTLIAVSPKAHYCDRVLLSGDAIQVSIIAKEYGLTATAFNRLLHNFGIQYKIGNKGTWLLYKEYANKGYTKSNTFFTPSGDCVVHMRWTQSGRRFLYDTLAEIGFYPIEERQPMFEF